jgi:hypothetical protein
MRIRLYPGQGPLDPSREVASICIGTRREGAFFPERVDPAARFYLETVQSEDPEQRQRLLAALVRDSVPVRRASSSRTHGGLRSRGDYRAEEPYGTPAYWRAALGRLPSDLGLRFDLADYDTVLQLMEAPTTTAVSATAEAPTGPRPDARRTT